MAARFASATVRFTRELQGESGYFRHSTYLPHRPEPPRDVTSFNRVQPSGVFLPTRGPPGSIFTQSGRGGRRVAHSDRFSGGAYLRIAHNAPAPMVLRTYAAVDEATYNVRAAVQYPRRVESCVEVRSPAPALIRCWRQVLQASFRGPRKRIDAVQDWEKSRLYSHHQCAECEQPSRPRSRDWRTLILQP